MTKKRKSNKLNLELDNIQPLNKKQANVLKSRNNMVLAGSAGTGKTFLASYLGYKAVLQDDEYDKLLYIRSAVSTRDIGFLPGSEKEKMKVYELPYVDIATTLFNRGDSYEYMKQKAVVHFEPTSFVRGTTFRNAFIIVDECQNMSYHELDSLITRLDDYSRIVFCGDIAQADLLRNGFGQFYKVLKEMEEFDFVEFGVEDIVRSKLVKSYLTKKAKLLGEDFLPQ